MTQTITELVAANVRMELARRRLGQVQVARVLGLSQAAVSRRLNGSVPLDVNELSLIADMLGMAASDLLPAAA